MRLLRIDSSARTGSVSRQLTNRFVEAWRAENPHGEVIERDLSKTPLPQITDAWDGTYSDDAAQTAEQRRYLALSDVLIDEIRDADDIVIGAPMYNFTISWPLKAWIDQIVRLNRTVAYGANGPRGMLSAKPVVILTSRGGSYQPNPATPSSDFQEPYLRRIFAFIGLTDLTFIHAEFQYRRGEQAAAGRSAALAQIDEMFAAHKEA
jgi:FMN-dependent NADH-azoreductase